MSVKIRLSRVGRKHVPMYRIVAVDSRKKRDGEALDMLGTFNAVNSTIVQFNQELYDSWVAKGAIPTDSVKKIYRLHKRTGKETASETPPAKTKKSPATEKSTIEKPTSGKIVSAESDVAKVKKTETAGQPEQAAASEQTKK